MNTKFYDGLLAFLRPFYALFWRGKVTGLENIPAEGGFVMCANHCSFRDPLFLGVRMPKRRYTYIGKAELFSNPLFRLVLGEKGLGGIPVKRGEADLGAIRQALTAVRGGQALGIFPQGTRSRDNTPTPMLSGVSMIAVMCKAPIIPVYIDGPYRRFHPVNICIGKPIDISDLGGKRDKPALDEVTHRIESAIWSMRDEMHK